MTTRILGLDVCKSSVAAWPIEGKPTNIKSYFRSNQDRCLKLFSNREGIQALKDLRPDVVVMEPTGVNYSKIWAKAALDCGAIVLWVGHSQLRSTRQSYLLPNKNDPADALALAIYAADHLGDPDYFISFDPFSEAAGIRERALQLSHIARVQSPIINRIRQNLAHEWPEQQDNKAQRKKGAELPPALWRYLAGHDIHLPTKTRYDNSLNQSCGSGLSVFTRHHAQHLCQIHEQEIAIEKEIYELIGSKAFEPYHQVFNMFGMGQRVRAMLLGHIYPLETFLGPNLKVLEDWVIGPSGKRTKRQRSLNAFRLRLGLGTVEDSSGQTTRNIPGGSALCRKALWQWEFTKIDVARNRPDNHIGRELGEYRDQLKDNGIPIQLVRSRVCARAVKRLFYELVKQLQSSRS